jgi:hypothetical protein
MHVDRASFLLLASTLFVACQPSEAQGTPPVLAPPAPSPTPVPLVASAPTQTAAPSASASAPVEPAPVAVAAPDANDEQYSFGSGAAVPPLAKDLHPQSCDVKDNAKGVVTACALSQPGPTCESFGDTKDECARYGKWLVPRAAAAATKCLQAKSGKQSICLFNVGMACAVEAWGATCLDPSPKIEAACAKVAQRCESVPKKHRHMTLDACKAALSAIIPSRHDKFLHCAAESCQLVQCAYPAEQ